MLEGLYRGLHQIPVSLSVVGRIGFGELLHDEAPDTSVIEGLEVAVPITRVRPYGKEERLLRLKERTAIGEHVRDRASMHERCLRSQGRL